MRLLTLILLFSLNCFSFEQKGVTFPDILQLDTTPLKLNGFGVRSATVFNIEVYYGVLYLTEKSTSDSEILKSENSKAMMMYFVRDVSKEDIKKAWLTAWGDKCQTYCDSISERNCSEVCQGFSSPKNQILKSIVDVKKGDRQILKFWNSKVAFEHNGKNLIEIAAPRFSSYLLSVWLGKNPPSEKLKSGLLGMK